MFKRFLKFFRGDDEAPDEPFEGSYLDHLLGQVKPVVVSQLAEEPDHDPLLLVVVGILRYTMINAWSPKLRSPLTDSQSPGKRPIPSALSDRMFDPAIESATTAEFDSVALAKQSEGEGLEADDGETSGSSEPGEESSEPEILEVSDAAEVDEADEAAPDAVVEPIDAISDFTFQANVPDAIFLIPGVGAQGGSATDLGPAFAQAGVRQMLRDDDAAWGKGGLTHGPNRTESAAARVGQPRDCCVHQAPRWNRITGTVCSMILRSSRAQQRCT